MLPNCPTAHVVFMSDTAFLWISECAEGSFPTLMSSWVNNSLALSRWVMKFFVPDPDCSHWVPVYRPQHVPGHLYVLTEERGTGTDLSNPMKGSEYGVSSAGQVSHCPGSTPHKVHTGSRWFQAVEFKTGELKYQSIKTFSGLKHNFKHYYSEPKGTASFKFKI